MAMRKVEEHSAESLGRLLYLGVEALAAHYHGAGKLSLVCDPVDGRLRGRVTKGGTMLYEVHDRDTPTVVRSLVKEMMRAAGLFDKEAPTHVECHVCTYIIYCLESQLEALYLLCEHHDKKSKAEEPTDPMDTLLNKVRRDQASLNDIFRTGKRRKGG